MTTTQIRPQPTPHVEPRKRRGRAGVALLFVLAGILVLLYPVIATSYNNYKQHEFATKYNHDVEQADPADLEQELQAAHAYNKSLDGIPILDPWLTHVSSNPTSESYQTYLGQLSMFDVMARIRVPSVDIDLPVRHGTTDAVLSKGAGHLYGTSLPVGGKGTHAVLTSHTGLATATLFDRLTSVQVGDIMYVDVAGQSLAYEVDQIKVVLPTEISDLTTVKGKDYLTLFTCTPYAVNTHRLLVRGHRVPYDSSLPGAVPDDSTHLHLEPFMWWMIGGALIGVVVIGGIVLRETRQRRRASAAGARP